MAGNLTQETNPLLQTTFHVYDARDQRVSSIDPLGRQVVTSYDAKGRVVGTVDPAGGVITVGYDSADHVISRTDPNNHTTAYSYDAAGELIQEVDPLGNATQYGYDSLGRRTLEVRPVVGATTTNYDFEGNVVSVLDSSGNATSFTYDLAGRRLTSTDALGKTTSSFYDAANQLTSQVDPAGGVTSFSYDNLGRRVTLVDPLNNATTFGYDSLNRLTFERNTLNAVRSFVYDVVGHLVQETDRNGRVREFSYDALDNQTQERWKSGSTTVRTLDFFYDSASRLTGAVDPDSVYSFSYDLMNRPLVVDNDGTPNVPRVKLTSQYDLAGNRTQVAAQVANSTGTLVNDYLTTYQYDVDNRVTRVQQVGQTGGNTVAQKRVDLVYNGIDELTTLTRYKSTAGGSSNEVATSNFSYDSLGRLTVLEHKKVATNTVIRSYTWSYDAVDRPTQFVSSLDGTQNFAYDTRDQLTSASLTTETFAYDANGNRSTTGYVTGANNRVTSDGVFNYTYDGEGNMIVRQRIASANVADYRMELTYYYRNRLTAVTYKNAQGTVKKTVAYAYDVFDRRLMKSVDNDGPGAGVAIVSRYVYDGDRIALAFNGSGASSSLKNRYLYGPAVDQVLADETVGGALLWDLWDKEGTVRDLINNSAGVVNHIQYSAFGKVLSETAASNGHIFGYAGRDRDRETGLDYFRARYYDPNLGRFVSEDPSGFAGGDANLSRYVGNHPTMATDPSGMEEEERFSMAWAVRFAIGMEAALLKAQVQGAREDLHFAQESNHNLALQTLDMTEEPRRAELDKRAALTFVEFAQGDSRGANPAGLSLLDGTFALAEQTLDITSLSAKGDTSGAIKSAGGFGVGVASESTFVGCPASLERMSIDVGAFIYEKSSGKIVSDKMLETLEQNCPGASAIQFQKMLRFFGTELDPEAFARGQAASFIVETAATVAFSMGEAVWNGLSAAVRGSGGIRSLLRLGEKEIQLDFCKSC